MKRITCWYVQKSDGSWEHNHIEDGWAIDFDRPCSPIGDKKQEAAWAGKKWKSTFGWCDNGLVSEKAGLFTSLKSATHNNVIPTKEDILNLEGKNGEAKEPPYRFRLEHRDAKVLTTTEQPLRLDKNFGKSSPDVSAYNKETERIKQEAMKLYVEKMAGNKEEERFFADRFFAIIKMFDGCGDEKCLVAPSIYRLLGGARGLAEFVRNFDHISFKLGMKHID